MPVFVLFNLANMHNSRIGWLILLLKALVYGFLVIVVYAEAAYFERRFFWLVFNIIGAHAFVG